MLGISDFLFYVLGLTSVICGLGVILSANPIYSALFLAATMIGIAGLFVTLDAYFIAGVQIIVYAGAVMVLFVMVLMLFDLKNEMKTFSTGFISNILKLGSCGMILGMLTAYMWYSFSLELGFKPVSSDPARAIDTTKALATTLFTKHLLQFEVIGVLLLVVAIGAVTLSRISGGTHADS